MQKHIIKVLENYKKIFPQEVNLIKYFDFLVDNKNDCTDRKNMNGHITVSGLVVKNDKVLLLWHKTLERYQQPGGHVDQPDKSIFDAAIREVKEETGLDVERVDGLYKNIPIYFDIHKIPENPKKGEGEHDHFDIMILLKLINPNQQICNTDEGTDSAKWVGISEIKKDESHYIYKSLEIYKKLFPDK